MAKWLVIALALLAGICTASSKRIVGGDVTTIEQYPSIVQVESLGIFTNTWGQSCAANVLTTYYLLTAAHCFEGRFYDRSRRRIRAGTTYRNTGGVVQYIVREFNHPTFGQNGADGDVSVILLQTPLVYSVVIQPVTIVSQGFVLPDNLPVVHAGWGATQYQGFASTQLRDVTIYTVNRDLCAERYLTLLSPPGIVTSNMICAGLLDVGGRDACQGDSGGPLYYGDILVGIVSWGHQCANATFPGISAAIGPYTNWIVATAS